MRSCVLPASATTSPRMWSSWSGGNNTSRKRREVVGIARHADRGGELDDTLAREAVERGIEQRGEDFAHPVGAEIEAQDAVAVLHALVVADHRRRDELVGLVAPRRRPRSPPTGSSDMAAFGVGNGGVGLGDAVPALVAVHREIAADDGGDAHAVRQRLAQRGEVVGGGLRRRVAAVGEGVHHASARRRRAGCAPAPRRGPGANARRRATPAPSDGRCPWTRCSLAMNPTQRRRLGEAAVGDRVADAHQLLLHHAAGADVHVADLGVAHLAVGQADVAAGGVQEGVRAGLPQLVKVGVRAWRTALSAASSRQPKPSRMTSMTGRIGCGIGRAFPVIGNR